MSPMLAMDCLISGVWGNVLSYLFNFIIRDHQEPNEVLYEWIFSIVNEDAAHPKKLIWAAQDDRVVVTAYPS